MKSEALLSDLIHETALLLVMDHKHPNSNLQKNQERKVKSMWQDLQNQVYTDAWNTIEDVDALEAEIQERERLKTSPQTS